MIFTVTAKIEVDANSIHLAKYFVSNLLREAIAADEDCSGEAGEECIFRQGRITGAKPGEIDATD